ADDMNQVVAQHVAEFVERDQLAAATKSGIDGQYAAAAYRGLQKQLSQIADEDVQRMLLGRLGQLAPRFPLEARYDQSLQRVAQAREQKLALRVLFGNRGLRGRLEQRIVVQF